MTHNPNPYSRWLKALDDFIEYSFSPYDYNEAQEDCICNLIRDTYIEIFKKLSAGSPGMEQWKYINALPLAVPTGFAVNHYSDRYETEFSFGTDEKGFFLQIMLNYPELLRKMDDRFWITAMELKHFGNIEFVENRDTADIGCLTVRWPLTIKFENLIENGNQAFKKLLSLNLALLKKKEILQGLIIP